MGREDERGRHYGTRRTDEHRGGGDVLSARDQWMKTGRGDVTQKLERGIHGFGHPNRNERHCSAEIRWRFGCLNRIKTPSDA
jgi:hypothetical protein